MICTRCRKEFDEKLVQKTVPDVFIIKEKIDFNLFMTIHLCGECSKRFRDWLNEKPEETEGDKVVSKKVLNALQIVNEAILDMNNGDLKSEDFYWWNAVLELFDLHTDDDGNITRRNGEGIDT